MWNFHILLSTKLAQVLKFKQPFRTRIYHFALQPKMIKYNESIDPEDPRLVKAVAPAQKWEHTGIVGMMTIRGEREVARNVIEIKLIQVRMRKNKSIANISESNATVINPATVIHEAVKNCTPLLLLQSVPRGGILYKVPAPPVSPSVATHTAVKFILDAARGKPRDQRIWISLANEFMVASQNQGKAVKYKVELHKQCEENRAYANFRSH
ncbi:unnamed protein product [Schistosoma margrebowiei]|uniref:Small ribosomal subunit protein uS7 domain-containing protein n=1 Tax=Schistosoma margrebowiei TaxID=48269 RepID=A0A183NAL1_9TREM|nr:unnamed protein product [Schistosoma margrebowiei]